jgi:hypothetical protein
LEGGKTKDKLEMRYVVSGKRYLYMTAVSTYTRERKVGRKEGKYSGIGI